MQLLWTYCIMMIKYFVACGVKIGHGDIVLSGDLLFKKRFISSVNQSCLHLWVCTTLNGCTSSPLPANTPSSSSRTSFTTPSPLDAILNKINELTPTRINSHLLIRPRTGKSSVLQALPSLPWLVLWNSTFSLSPKGLSPFKPWQKMLTRG